MSILACASRLFLTLSLLGLTSCSPPIPDGPVTAPTSKATAINQIPIEKNGCGPISLMNAYQFGSPIWHTGYKKLSAKSRTSNKQKFTYLVHKYGLRISRHNDMIRWDKRIGISSLDLCDLANDYQRANNTHLPQLKVKSLFKTNRESHSRLLQRTHQQLRDSLLHGFPPILSVKRFAKRSMGKFRIWKQIHGHFVVLYQIPGKIPADATSFQIKYIDPWGGTIKTGTIKIPTTKYYAIDTTNNRDLNFKKSPALIVDFPQSKLGSHLLRRGENSVTIVASAIQP